MKQLITTTDISTIRPVFSQGSSENIKRFTQLKKLFEKNKEYCVFAEPSPAGGQNVAWYTSFEGDIIRFSELSENEQEKAKGRLKTQVNKLYKAAIKHLEISNGKISGSHGDLFELIDSCIEIPDYNDIYVIKQADGVKNFVIIRWGFTSDDFHAKSGLIKGLIPLKVATISVKAIYTNNKTASSERIFIENDGETFDAITNKDGKIFIEDVSFFTKIYAYQINNNEKENIHNYLCDDRNDYFFRIGVPTTDMNFVFSDNKGNAIPHARVTFKYQDEEIQKITDSAGKIILEDISIKTDVQCFQDNGDTQLFTCSLNQNEYKYIGSQPKVSMRFLVVDNNDEPIEGAQIKFVNKGELHKTSNVNGNIILSEIEAGTKVQCYQVIDNETIELQSHICKINKTIYKLVGKRPVEPEPETVILHSLSTIQFQIVDSKKNPIDNTVINFQYDGENHEHITNTSGIVTLKNISVGTNIKTTIDYNTKKFENEFECKNKSEFHQIILAKEKKPIWWWLVPLILVLLILLGFFLKPILFPPLVIVNSDTIAKDTVVEPIIVEKTNKIIILDDETKQPISGAVVVLEYNSKKDSIKCNSEGKAIFKDIPDGVLIKATIKSTDYKNLITEFTNVEEKIIYLSKNKSFDVSEIPIPCGSMTESGGFGTTIKVYYLKKAKGKFKLFYNMYQLPDKLNIYNGRPSEMSEKTLIFTTNKPVTNNKISYVNFSSSDSLITVEAIGINNKTRWIYKIFCPK